MRHSPRDAWFIGLALLQGAVLLTAPPWWFIALALWWNANTIAHNFIHLPWFSSRRFNALFSVCLSLVQGIPQTLWRDRHLAHHAGMAWRWRWSRPLAVETILVCFLWAGLLSFAPTFFLSAYLPGYCLGLGLCRLQGYFEHHRGTQSHYGWLYNLLFFNDGYHREHHERPAEHWTRLPAQRAPHADANRWPAVLRWMELFNLNCLERLVLRSTWLQRFVLKNHECAFHAMAPKISRVRCVWIVGGGLFPRTALILQRLLPEARLRIIDASSEHLQQARVFLNGEAEYVHQLYDAAPAHQADLLVIPLSYIGDRARIYQQPPAPLVLVHDWIWNRRGHSVVVSWPLLKRLNLVQA